MEPFRAKLQLADIILVPYISGTPSSSASELNTATKPQNTKADAGSEVSSFRCSTPKQKWAVCLMAKSNDIERCYLTTENWVFSRLFRSIRFLLVISLGGGEIFRKLCCRDHTVMVAVQSIEDGETSSPGESDATIVQSLALHTYVPHQTLTLWIPHLKPKLSH